jgi:AraC-like DNA-binding protein
VSSIVEPAPSIEAMAADWVGHYYVGRTFLVWSWSATLGGTVFWGTPAVDDALGIAGTFAAIGEPHDPPYDLISDASRLESVAPEALAAFVPAVRRSLERNEHRIRRHGVVGPDGIWGVVVAGVVPFISGSHPWKLFADPGAAYAWVEHADAGAAMAEVEAIVERERAQPPAIRALRGYLAGELAPATLDRAARALATSSRSLQRELARGGTTFQRELDHARVRTAVDLVNLSELKLEAIAAHVGLSSLPKLNDVFRRVLGVTPGQLRARRASGTL